MERTNPVYWLLACLGINRLCSLVPYRMFDPFPFYDIQISASYYIYAISNHLIVMVLMYLLATEIKSKLSSLISAYFWIEVLSLVDFFLIYEHAMFKVYGYGVEFTDIKILLYVILFIRWNRK